MVSWFRGFWFHGFMVSRFQGFIQIGIGIGIAIGIDRFTTEHFPGFQGFGVSGFHGFIQIGIGIAIGIGIDHLTTEHFLGFHGFKVSGFMVSSKSGSGSLSGSGSSTRDPRHSTRDDRQGRLSPAYAPVSKTPSIALAAKYGDYVYSRGCSPPKKPLRLRASALKKRPTHTRSPSPKQSVRDRGMRV